MTWEDILKAKISRYEKENIEKLLYSVFNDLQFGHYGESGWENTLNPIRIEQKINQFNKRYSNFFNSRHKLQATEVEGKIPEIVVSYSYGPLNEKFSFKKEPRHEKQKPSHLTQNQLDSME